MKKKEIKKEIEKKCPHHAWWWRKFYNINSCKTSILAFSTAFPEWDGQISIQKTWNKLRRYLQQWGLFPRGLSNSCGAVVCVSEWYRYIFYTPYAFIMPNLFEILLLSKISDCILIVLEKKHFIFRTLIKSFTDIFKRFQSWKTQVKNDTFGLVSRLLVKDFVNYREPYS